MSLVLNWSPSGKNGRGTLSAMMDGDTIHVESMTIGRSKARDDFADAICNAQLDIDRATVESELLKMAGEIAAETSADPVDPSGLPEIDLSRIVRPERIITPEVSALAVPTMATLGDKVTGRWQLYLHWADGKRERRTLGPTLDLGDDTRLWIHPMPAEPSPATKSGWSAESRKRWLEGEPAPDPAEVFRRVCEGIAYFIDLPADQGPGITATLAIWTLLSYCYHAWPAVPYLYVGGPLGSGKSRVFEILSRLVLRPLSSSNMSGPAMFRTLHDQGGTLLLDEAEQLRNTRDPNVGEISAMLLAGYKRGGCAMRLEPIGESGFRMVSFDVFGPKALACISGLPPALGSRCIPIIMFRAGPGSPKPRRRIDADPGGWQRLRDDLHVLALEHGPTWLKLADRDDVCPNMSGRDYELWQPLLALASWIEASGAQGLLGLLQEHALATIDAGRDDQTPPHDETLLRILTESIQFGERPTPGELLDKAKESDLESFRRWSPKAVGDHLRRYGLATSKVRGRKVYGQVTMADLGRVQTNYGIDLGIEKKEEDHPEQCTP